MLLPVACCERRREATVDGRYEDKRIRGLSCEIFERDDMTRVGNRIQKRSTDLGNSSVQKDKIQVL